jgi:ribonuclease-3
MSRPERLEWTDLALRHSSWAHEQGGDDNERLEFLGDAVLEQLVSLRLFEKYPEDSEGVLSRTRARLVSTEQLAQLSRDMGLDKRVLLGKGEENSGGRERDRLLAGLFEAWLAALYLEEGMPAAAEIVDRRLVPLFEQARNTRNPKQVVQEWAQKQYGEPPHYHLIGEEGPDHARSFGVSLRVGERHLSEGWGPSKRQASVEAARQAVEALGIE